MKDRQTSSNFQPRRCRTFIIPLLINEEIEIRPDFFLVAKENAVSLASETRVMDGCASLVEISCMAASPASQEGNKYPKITRTSGMRCTWTVTSVITPSRPSDPSTISRTLGPVEVCGNGRSSNTLPGIMTRMPRAMSEMSPYLSDCMPDDLVATHPPRVLWVKLSGKCPIVQPRPPSCCSKSGPCAPA